jgi:hypothetical protein
MTNLTVVERDPGYALVSLRPPGGWHASTDLRSRLRQLLHDGVQTLVVDVSAVEELTDAETAALLWATGEAAARGGRLVLRTPTRDSADMVARSDLAGAVEVDSATTSTALWRHP